MKKKASGHQVELQKIVLPADEPKKKRKPVWRSLAKSISGHTSGERIFDLCRRRGLEVIINTTPENGVATSVAGCVGVAQRLYEGFVFATQRDQGKGCSSGPR